MTVQRLPRTTPRVRYTALAALSISALMLAGCSNGDPQANGAVNSAKETVSASANGTHTDTGSSGAASAGPSPLGEADAAMKTLRPEAPSQLLVTDVRTGSHSGFDRIVFDLTGDGEPGWFIDYTSSPTQQGSGNGIDYTGTIALNVNIDGTRYPFDLGLEDPQIGTVEGTGGIVTEVISAGTFEGRSQFVIGLNGTHPYSVNVLQDPHRLVVDLLAN